MRMVVFDGNTMVTKRGAPREQEHACNYSPYRHTSTAKLMLSKLEFRFYGSSVLFVSMVSSF